MGRKSAASVAKSKTKRLQRKEEQNRISQSMAVVAAANALEDPLEAFPVFRNYQTEGLDVELYIQKGPQLDPSVKQFAFDLMKRNMQPKYEQCDWGWSDEKKMEELNDDAAWFLMAKLSRMGAYVGFSHFRFDMDEGIEVLYCYELQLEPAVQRKGLGKFMMQILELIAFKNNMRKVVLTVLKNNQNSKFFKYINYELDESSPTEEEAGEDLGYEILSKVNKRLGPVENPPKMLPKSRSKYTIYIDSKNRCCSGHGHHAHNNH